MARITKLELQQINARLAAENEALRAELSKLRNDAAIQRAERRQAPDASERRQSPDASERCAKLEALKAFATKFRCTARLRDGVIELYSKKRGCWVTVPEGAQP